MKTQTAVKIVAQIILFECAFALEKIVVEDFFTYYL